MLRTMTVTLAAAGLSLGVLSGAPALAEEAEAGNNLSYPALWVDEELTVPGTMGVEVFDGSSASVTDCDGVAYLQKDPDNSWQADNASAPGTSVTDVDWGDNLEAKDWTVGSKVRVETVLYANGLAESMTGYTMCHVSGQGQTEVWGAVVDGNDAVLTEDPSAIIYSAGGRLTIQRITDPTAATWSATEHQWVGTGVTAPVFNLAAHERTSDGPGSYGAELNVQGKVIYGMLWDTVGAYNGEYRLTFSLDGPMGDFAGTGTDLNTAQVLVPVEEDLDAIIEATAGGGGGGGGGSGGGRGGGEGEGNTAIVENGITYIDVALTGGTDAPVDPVDPGDPGDETTPPSTGGGTTAAEEPVQVQESEGSGPQAGAPIEVAVPTAATALIRQRAVLGMPKAGKRFTVGDRLVLAKAPVKTTAGVTVRWRVTTQSRDNCTVKTLRGTKNPQNRGRATLTMVKPVRCTVEAWAPAPSPEHQEYRKTFTYRVAW